MKCCGIEESMEKATPPSTKMVLIGIVFDTDNVTISIDENRLSEIIDLVTVWLDKCSCSKKELQSLLGKLNYVSQCVRHGRLFVSTPLNWLREISDVDAVSIKVITKLPNSEQSYKGKVKTHNYINRQNQSTTGKL